MTRRLLLAALVLLPACGGGGPGYVLRAGWSEARILLRRRPIAELLARPDLDPTLRERLELVRAVRTFAAGPLGLRVGQNYATFAELDRDATAYVLSAAHRDRLAPYTWWYPIVGRVPYQGFFDRPAAGSRRAASTSMSGLRWPSVPWVGSRIRSSRPSPRRRRSISPTRSSTSSFTRPSTCRAMRRSTSRRPRLPATAARSRSSARGPGRRPRGARRRAGAGR